MQRGAAKLDNLAAKAFLIVTSLSLQYVAAFLPRRSISTSSFGAMHGGNERCAVSSIHMAAINFDGESSASIFVPVPPDISNPERTLPDWLLHSPASSDKVLLGTDDYRSRKDGMYDCIQPGVDWFGLELVPVFVNRIDRSEVGAGGVTVRIIEARSEMRSGGGGPAGAVIKSAMEKSKFSGRYGVSWRNAPRRSISSKDGWTLSADLALTLTVPLPGLLPLPPGFNSIGSRIVKSTCRKRVEKNLVNLRDAYVRWARQSEDATN